jgi:predicted CXXCH cytochrome family protein
MRVIRDTYELPESDDDGWGYGLRPRRRRSSSKWILLIALLLPIMALGYMVFAINRQESSDTFCVSCHTQPEQTYHRRSVEASAGAFAVDLASYHYQQIRGRGGNIRCIDCHEGDHSATDRFDKWIMSAGHAIIWLQSAEDNRIEKIAITTTQIITLPTQSAGEAITKTMPPPVWRAASLSNDGCVSCHLKTLLLAGMSNHMHNMLPPAYATWKAGARLIVSPDVKDPQSMLNAGLVKLDTSITCNSCHRTHQTIDADRYLNQTVVDLACEQCHRETRR